MNGGSPSAPRERDRRGREPSSQETPPDKAASFPEKRSIEKRSMTGWTLAVRVLLFLVITVCLRLAWPLVASEYMVLLIFLSRLAAPLWGLRITDTQFREDGILLQCLRGTTADQFQLHSGIENYLPFNLIVFLGLAFGLSFGRFRTQPRRSVRTLLTGLAVLVASHVAILLCLMLSGFHKPDPPIGLRVLKTLLNTTAPLLPLLLWVIGFTDLRQRLGFVDGGPAGIERRADRRARLKRERG